MKRRMIKNIAIAVALAISLSIMPNKITNANATWTVVNYSTMTDAQLSTADKALMHEDNWLNNYVATNRGKTLATLTLSDFLSIRELTKINSSITTIPPSIKFMTNLNILYLYDNKIATIPPEIGNLMSLSKMYLQGNQLTSLPTEIGNLTNLTTLSLSLNKLTDVPTTLWNLINLNALYLAGNQLTSINTNINKLTKLNDLYLHCNKLTTVPSALWGLRELTTLSLYGNQLTSLSPSVGNLTNLKILYICNNQFTSIPTEIGNLVNLEILYINDNQLTTLPSSINNLTKLNNSNFHLENNYFTSKLPNFPNANYSNNFINVVSPHSDLDFITNTSMTIDVGSKINVSDIIKKTYFATMPQSIIDQLQVVADDPTIIDSTGKALKYGKTNIRVKFPNNPVGNTSGITQTSIQVTVSPPDTVGPTTPTITLNNSASPINSNISFTVGGSTDALSGVNKYQYMIDPLFSGGVYTGTWKDYSTPVTVSTEGNHLVVARAVDNAGNYSSIATKQFTIDKTAPVVNLTQTLAESKIDSTINYSVTETNFNNIVLPDGTMSTSKTGTFKASSNGTYSFKVTDKAGNVTTKTIDVTEISSVQVTFGSQNIITFDDNTEEKQLSLSVTSSTNYDLGIMADTDFVSEDNNLSIPIEKINLEINDNANVVQEINELKKLITLSENSSTIGKEHLINIKMNNPTIGYKAGKYTSKLSLYVIGK